MTRGAWKDGKVERTFRGQMKYHFEGQEVKMCSIKWPPWPRMVMFTPKKRTLESKNGIIFWSALKAD